jgi:hypothetical protein
LIRFLTCRPWGKRVNVVCMCCPKASLRTHRDARDNIFSSSFFKTHQRPDFDKQTIATKTTNYPLTLIILSQHTSSILPKCVRSSPHTFFFSHQLPSGGMDTRQPYHVSTFLSHGLITSSLETMPDPKSSPTSHAIHKFSFLDYNFHCCRSPTIKLPMTYR